MKKLLNIKIIFSSILMFAVVLVIIFVINNHSQKLTENTTIPTIYLNGSFAIDTNDQTQLVGDADYVFIGKVNKLIDTEYKMSVSLETKNGTKEISTPYTNYSVTVIENVKGDLITNAPINIQKAGGITKDSAEYIIFENDIILEVGNTYTFYAYTQSDGSLLVAGPNSNAIFDITDAKEIKDNSMYKKLLDAYDNQNGSDTDILKSKYDINK